MPLTSKEKQRLKSKAHPLKPIVLIGNNGLTDAVIQEIERGLYDHELIKVRIQADDRESRQTVLINICQATNADLVQYIGNIGVFYRKSDKFSDDQFDDED